MIISIDAEKTIDKIKYQFMIKKQKPLRVNPNENYGLGVIMVCHYKFITYEKHIIWIGDVDNERDYASMEGIWEISMPFS